MKITFRRTATFVMFGLFLTCTAALLISCASDDDGPEEPVEEEEDVLQFGTVTDRDGNIYTTVVLGGHEWMTENLRTALITGLANCYNDEDDNCGYYGSLYTLTAVMEGETSSTGASGVVLPVQGICPEGWRLPTREDWEALPASRSAGEWNADDLKSESELWTAGGSGTNASGFGALPGGLAQVNDAGDFNYLQEGQRAAFWSVTSPNSDSPQFGFFGLSAEDDAFEIMDYQSGLNQIDPDSRAHSCRCLRDL